MNRRRFLSNFAFATASGLFLPSVRALPPIIQRRLSVPRRNISASVWQTFDWGNTTLNAGNLTTGDKGTDKGTWSVTGAVSTIDPAASKPVTAHTVYGYVDSSVNGLAVDLTTGVAAGVKDIFAVAPSANVVCVYGWFYVPAGLANSSNCQLLKVSEGSEGNYPCYVRILLSTANYRFYLSGVTSNIYMAIPATNAWYWLALLSLNSGNCYLHAYTSLGAEIAGSPITNTGYAKNAIDVRIGPITAPTANAVSLYIDSVIVDAGSNASTNYPILPV